MALPPDHPSVSPPKVGVLLVNLGTPDGYDTSSMRRYLKQFLSDPRVIEAPAWLWQPILHGIILNTRPRKSGEAYEKIWRKETDESPLRFYTREQTEAVAARFPEEELTIDWAMRYGSPSIPDRLQALQDRGCQKLVVLPLYPQYSAATTASVVDETMRYLMSKRWQPALRTLDTFHDDPDYIEALAASVRSHLDGKPGPEKILCSFHGLPRENLDKGDPYHCFCQKTGRLLAEALGMGPDRFQVVFQSRFGPKEWLQPYADKTVETLAQDGVRSIAMISPGFVADCVETLEELSIGLRETFLEHGGESFDYIPCLNATEPMIDLLEKLIRRELSGWVAETGGDIERHVRMA